MVRSITVSSGSFQGPYRYVVATISQQFRLEWAPVPVTHRQTLHNEQLLSTEAIISAMVATQQHGGSEQGTHLQGL